MNEIRCKKCGRYLGKEGIVEGSWESAPCPNCGTVSTIDRQKVVLDNGAVSVPRIKQKF